MKDPPAKLTTVKLAKSAPQIAEKVISVGHAGIGFLWAAKTCSIASIGERQQDASIAREPRLLAHRPRARAPTRRRAQKKSCDERKKHDDRRPPRADAGPRGPDRLRDHARRQRRAARQRGGRARRAEPEHLGRPRDGLVPRAPRRDPRLHLRSIREEGVADRPRSVLRRRLEPDARGHRSRRHPRHARDARRLRASSAATTAWGSSSISIRITSREEGEPIDAVRRGDRAPDHP